MISRHASGVFRPFLTWKSQNLGEIDGFIGSESEGAAVGGRAYHGVSWASMFLDCTVKSSQYWVF